MTILLVLIAVVSSILGGRVVQVRSHGSPGLIAGVFGCLFGLLGIFTIGIIFVPLAALCGVVGLLRGLGAFGLAGIGTSLLALVLSGIGFMTSPILWAVTASLLAGYVAHSGSTHLAFQKSYLHVVSGPNSETWRPEDGYVWLRQPPNGDFRVQWQPGRPSEKFRHVVTASAEERWFPEDGYAWDVNPPPAGQLGVHWVAGKPSAQFAHVISGTVEGQWFPEDGFEWNITPPPKGQLAVHWVPGISSKSHFHLVSAITEGHWLPDSGYRWIVDPPSPGDFRVEPLLPPTNPAVNAEIVRRPDNVDEPSARRALAQEREFLFGIDHGQGQYAFDLACSEADPPCPRWWEYARGVSN